MLLDELNKMQNYCYEQEKYQLNISVLDEKYTIYTNYSKSIAYFKGLFYPCGVNGVSVIEDTTENKNIIRCIQSVDKQIFWKLVKLVKNHWRLKGKVSPVINGYYDMYEMEDSKCFIQDYANTSSEEHIIFLKGGNYSIISINALHEYMILSRFVREIGFRKLKNNGFIGLHASAVEINSHGYLIIGDSGAGKSTLALTLGKYYKAKYISNDRIMIKVTDDEIIAIPFGMPIKVNYGTLKTLEVQNDFEKWDNMIPLISKDTFYDYNGENKLNLLPKEIEKFMNINVGSIINVKGIIFPSVNGNYKKSSNYEIIKRNCYFEKEPVYIEDWLGIEKILEPISYGYILEKLVCLELYRMEINVTEFRRCADKIMHLIKNRS